MGLRKREISLSVVARQGSRELLAERKRLGQGDSPVLLGRGRAAVVGERGEKTAAAMATVVGWSGAYRRQRTSRSCDFCRVFSFSFCWINFFQDLRFLLDLFSVFLFILKGGLEAIWAQYTSHPALLNWARLAFWTFFVLTKQTGPFCKVLHYLYLIIIKAVSLLSVCRQFYSFTLPPNIILR